MASDEDKKKVKKKVVGKVARKKRKVWKLKDEGTRKNFEKRVGELVGMDALDLWGCFKDG